MVIQAEVAVLGAGPAGIVAAIASARSGSKVALVEKNPFIGGNAALGLSLHNFHDFSGRRCINGIAGEMVERLKKMGGTPGSVEVRNAQITKVTPVNEEVLAINTQPNSANHLRISAGSSPNISEPGTM